MSTSPATWSCYRADCIPHQTGCRQCGAPLKFASRAYCSKPCRRAFEMNHFWSTARNHAIYKTDPAYSLEAYIADGTIATTLGDDHTCAKCKRTFKGYELEVNHMVALNGIRPFFGCCHHQSNLEPVCHDCHVEETKRQRNAGEIGPPRTPYATPLFDHPNGTSGGGALAGDGSSTT